MAVGELGHRAWPGRRQWPMVSGGDGAGRYQGPQHLRLAQGDAGAAEEDRLRLVRMRYGTRFDCNCLFLPCGVNMQASKTSRISPA